MSSEHRTPDERVYSARAESARMFGTVEATRMACADYLASPSLHAYPSPIRWMWTWWTRWVGIRWVSYWGCVAGVAVVALGWPGPVVLPMLSPLANRLSERHLQDTTVAALVLATLSLSLHGHPWLSCLTFALLLGIKESALPYVGAWALSLWIGATGGVTDKIICAAAIVAGVFGWLVATRLACGPLAWRVLLAGRHGHRTDYTRDHQSGMPHRLLADLVLVSPWVVALAIAHPSRELAIAAVILAVHALTPVRNVRTVLAADLLLRVSVGAWLTAQDWRWSVPLTLALCAYDVWVARRLRTVFDPVTSALMHAVGR